MRFCLYCFLLFFTTASAHPLMEKLAAMEENRSSFLSGECGEVGEQIGKINERLKELSKEILEASKECTEQQRLYLLLQQVSALRQERALLQLQWLDRVTPQESCSAWQQQQTTLGELLVEYAQRYVYLVPEEIANFPITLAGQVPIPSSCWEEMLESILTQNGFELITLNPFLRTVVQKKVQPFAHLYFTSQRKELQQLAPQSSVCFVLTTHAPDPHEVFQALQRFVNPELTSLALFGQQIYLLGTVEVVGQLLKLEQMMTEYGNGSEYQLLRLCHLNAQEAQKILTAYFMGGEQVQGVQQLKVLALDGNLAGVFVVGTREQIAKAEQLLFHVEQQVNDPKELVLYTYICQHAQPEEMAKVLNRVYKLLLNAPLLADKKEGPMVEVVYENKRGCDSGLCSPTQFNQLYAPQSPCDPSLIVAPSFNRPPNSCQDKKEPLGEGNFVVDPKSGSITMVVEKEVLGRLKELLKRLDRPKKMVKIEVLLFEKKITEEDHFGLNLLKIGSPASNTHKTGLIWNDLIVSPLNEGILTFFMSRPKSSSNPAFDFIYRFLLSQENIQINACPSVTTLNQTPAKIALVEELSINNGAVILDTDCGPPFLKEAYTRTQYGITIDIVPTIHLAEDCLEEGGRFITLETDITFDTVHPSRDHRPDVTRRNIKNQVRVPDGQTVILGGLRRKITRDRREAMPILGEVPYFGKLFSETEWHDHQTEMFICLTPTIVEDEVCFIEQMNAHEVCKRPGDLPDFLAALDYARRCQRYCQVTGGLKMLLRNSP